MRIGERFVYPDFRLNPELVEATRKLYGKKGMDTIGWELAADVMGYSAKSSSYRAKIGAMKDFGLIDGTESKGLVVTEMGRKLAEGDSDEQQEALVYIIKKVPLWNQFYNKWTANGKVPPDDTFWDDLKQITGIPPDDARKIADKVRGDYLADIVHLKATQEGFSKSAESVRRDSPNPQNTFPPVDVEHYQLGKAQVWLPRENTEETWKRTKKAIDVLLGLENA